MKRLKRKYLTKLVRLVREHDENRRERFIPFLILLQNDKDHPRFREALAIASYFLDNALLVNREDEDFHRVLANAIKEERPPDYLAYAGKMPYPLADYLKVVYDLRDAPSGFVATTIKQDVIVQIEKLMKQQNLTKTALAQKMNTSRASLDRLLDPKKSVTLQTLQRVADALDRDISLRFV
jgi:antitoxin component HigA of HigAB toxin-antitoxin module